MSGIGAHAARDLSQPGPTYCSGGGKPVYINLNIPPEAAALGIEDQPPASWTVSDISSPGAWDAANQKVKWGPFFAPGFPTQVSYTVTPPPGTTGSHCFNGETSIDGVNEPIYGESCVSEPSYIPADAPQPPCTGCSNCTCGTCEDGRVVMCEMIAYACAWKRGCNDELDLMTRAATIWMEGECYCWNNAQQWWSPSTCPAPESMCCPGRDGGDGPRDGGAARQLPVYTPPQTWFAVQIDVAPSAEVVAVGLEDQPPAGWQVRAISDSGAWDGVHGKVKWGPFFVGQMPDYVTYELLPPEGASGTSCFAGAVSFDGWNQSVTGDPCIVAAAWSKGDLNCDGAVNTQDVGPFVLALLEPSAYESQYPGCDITLADLDSTGNADGLDIQPFVNALLGG